MSVLVAVLVGAVALWMIGYLGVAIVALIMARKTQKVILQEFEEGARMGEIDYPSFRYPTDFHN